VAPVAPGELSYVAFELCLPLSIVGYLFEFVLWYRLGDNWAPTAVVNTALAGVGEGIGPLLDAIVGVHLVLGFEIGESRFDVLVDIARRDVERRLYPGDRSLFQFGIFDVVDAVPQCATKPLEAFLAVARRF